MNAITGNTIFWAILLGVLVIVAVFFIMKMGLVHPEPAPEKPEDSRAVERLRKLNAERLAKIEAGRARALASGETADS